MTNIKSEEIAAMEKYFRIALIKNLLGYKSLKPGCGRNGAR